MLPHAFAADASLGQMPERDMLFPPGVKQTCHEPSIRHTCHREACSPKSRSHYLSFNSNDVRSNFVSFSASLQPYTGKWRGAITCGMFQNVEHVIAIDNNEKMMTVSQVVSGSGGVNGSAAAFVGADGVTVKFPWPNGTWALKPNPDGKTARVRLTSTFGPFSMDNSATFHREHSN